MKLYKSRKLFGGIFNQNYCVCTKSPLERFFFVEKNFYWKYIYLCIDDSECPGTNLYRFLPVYCSIIYITIFNVYTTKSTRYYVIHKWAKNSIREREILSLLSNNDQRTCCRWKIRI